MAVSKADKSAMFQALYNGAHAAGMAAAEKRIPVPMIVQERANPLDDSSPVVRQYAPVMGGVCGFAWIIVKPGNSPFANWLKDKRIGDKDSYNGGVNVWVSYFGQSMEKKEAYAYAFAEFLRNAGIKAYADSRMD